MHASFEAWFHTEAGLDFEQAAQYTRQELNRLQLGWLVRESPGSTEQSDDLSKAKARAQQRHRETTDEMLTDLGFD